MTDAAMTSPLRLLACDAEDLQVLSAACQDAVLKVGDLNFDSKRRRFVLVLNRFKWEDQGARSLVRGSAPFARVRSGLQFGGVLKASSSGFDRRDKDAVLALLAVAYTPGAEGAGVIVLQFAGGAALRLEVECVDAALSDLTEPWPTARKPRHDLAGKDG